MLELIWKRIELSIPGYLQLIQGKDFVIQEKIGEGGSGNIHIAVVKAAGARRLNGDKDRCVIKLIERK